MSNIVSVRVGSRHITLDGEKDFKHINAAKRHSRTLGGAKAVRSFDKHPGELEVSNLLNNVAAVATVTEAVAA
ncbi:MAG: hypothetical protein JWP44_5115 [Mucilaginibacter sp.]|nr:hypothetical protein [Mucilaginibacter sp.]